MSIADRLRWVREISGLSRRGLAALCPELSEGSIRHVESGLSETLTTESAQKVAAAIGCSVGWLLVGEGNPPSEESLRALRPEPGVGAA